MLTSPPRGGFRDLLVHTVPDIEQGYVGPTAKGGVGLDSDFWRREFTVSKLTWANPNLGHQQQEESKGHLRLCCYRDGIQAWSKNGCVWRSDWKQISSFGLSGP